MAFTALFEKTLLDFMTGAAAATQPSARFISLATGSPNDAGASDGPYQTRLTLNCGAASSPLGIASNRSVMSFRATAIATAVGWNLWDAGAAGNRLAYGTISPNVGVASGGTAAFAVSALALVLR